MSYIILAEHEKTDLQFYETILFKKKIIQLFEKEDLKNDDFHDDVFQFHNKFYHYIPFKNTIKWLFEEANDYVNPNSYAQYWIGHLYFNGYGVPKNLKIAMSWFEKSYENNNIYALNYIGILYQYDEKNMKQIKYVLDMINCFTNSANKGNEFAKYNLAHL